MIIQDFPSLFLSTARLPAIMTLLHRPQNHVTMLEMKTVQGEIVEVWLQNGQVGGRIHLSSPITTGSGQYLMAHAPEEADMPLAAVLFPAELEKGNDWIAAPPLPQHWLPGTVLELSGPYGHGFQIPVTTTKMALISTNPSPARLFPLIGQALAQDCAIALYTNASLSGPDSQLPAAVEIQPLDAANGAVLWADYLAIDLSIGSIKDLRSILGIEAMQTLSTPTQVLVFTQMPCGGQAECGVCAISPRPGKNLACKHGPVFALNELEW